MKGQTLREDVPMSARTGENDHFHRPGYGAWWAKPCFGLYHLGDHYWMMFVVGKEVLWVSCREAI